MVNRCKWAESEDMLEYHDCEWGKPVHEDRLLFEFLILEGAQAGLSWSTILKRREGYKKAFDNFDINNEDLNTGFYNINVSASDFNQSQNIWICNP